MAEGKTHWKKLINPDYIGAYSLEAGKDLTVTIEKVVREMVTGDGGKKDECTVAYLKGQKPFILNRTNSKTIQKLYNSPYIEDWAGKQITLYATTTRVAGDTVECLRVRSTVPKVGDDVQKAIKEVLAVKSREELDTLWKNHKLHQTDQNFLKAVKDMGLKYPIQ